MKTSKLLLFLSLFIFSTNCFPSNNSFLLTFEIQNSSIKEIEILYSKNMGLTEVDHKIQVENGKTYSFVLDSIQQPTSMSLLIDNKLYPIWAEPNSDLKVIYSNNHATYSGKGKIYTDYYGDSREFLINTYNSFSSKYPIMGGKPQGYLYFCIQDSISTARLNFLDSYFKEYASPLTKQFVEREKSNLLYSELFYELSGLTSLKDFKFYQDLMKISKDSFLFNTDKFDFNKPELFNIGYYRRCIEFLYFKYSWENSSDSVNGTEHSINFACSLSNNDTCKRYIEIISLNHLISGLLETKNFSLNNFIDKKIRQIEESTINPVTYTHLLKLHYNELLNEEKKSKVYISLLKNPNNKDGLLLKDASEDVDYEFLRTIIIKYPNKVLYIDFWAPWCKPCMNEFVNSKAFYEKYQDKNIVFINFAIECSEKSWKSTIKQQNLKGEHYLLNDLQTKTLEQKFSFNAIPHSILINKEGIIISTSAPRLSEIKEIDELFSRLLK